MRRSSARNEAASALGTPRTYLSVRAQVGDWGISGLVMLA